MKRALFLLSLVAALSLTACSTLEYRGIQSEFEEAVRADNARAVSPFLDGAGEDFTAVLAKLTPAYIAGLEARLQPNAWMLRSVAAWRAGDDEAARSAASEGLKLNPDSESRDAVVMTMIPGLVTESDVMVGWRESGRTTTAAAYPGQRDDLQTAWGVLIAAEDEIGGGTPDSTSYYVQYQKWRVAQNWRELIHSVVDADGAAKKALRDWVETNVTNAALADAAKAARDAIPDGSPLRDLIRAQGGG